MVNWANLVFEWDMGATIEQIKVLSRYTFLVIVRNFEEKQRILEASPLYMDGRMVATAPWEKDLNFHPISPADTPVWVDLVALDPLLEIHANFLLKQVGQLDFALTSTSLSRFVHIPGMVHIDVEDAGTTRIEVAYHSLPYICKMCNEGGRPV